MSALLSVKPQIKIRVTHQTFFDREARGLELQGPPSGDGRLLLDEQAVRKLIVFLNENSFQSRPATQKGNNQMSKTKDEIRPLAAIAPEEHADREGATEYSGYQPTEKFANQGSKPYALEDALNSPTRSGLQEK